MTCEAYEDSRRAFTAVVNKGALKMAMTFHGHSYGSLAKKSDLSKSTIRNLVGPRATCNPETAAKVAKALNVETTDLFTLKVLHV